MIVCTKCGFRNEEGAAFCGSCSSFLEWTGARLGDEPPEPAIPEPAALEPAAPEAHGLLDRVREAVGLGGPGSASPAGSVAGVAGGQPTEGPVADDGPAGSAFAPQPPAATTEPTVVRGSRVYRAVEDGAPASGLEATPAEAPAPTASAQAPTGPTPAAPGPTAPFAPPATAPFAPPATAPFAPPATAPFAPPATAPFAPPATAPFAPPATAPFAPPATAPFAPPAIAPVPPATTPFPSAAASVPPAPAAPVAPPTTPVAPPTTPVAPPTTPAASVPAATVPAAPPPAAPPIRPAAPESTNPLIRPARPAPAPTRKPLVEAAPAPAIPEAAPPAARPVAPPVVDQPPAQPPAARPVAAPSVRRPAGAGSLVASPGAQSAVPAAADSPGALPAAVSPADQPASVKPTAQKPGPPERRTTAIPKATADTPAPNPGDLICGNCGIGNDPARKFCRRCGQSLAEAAIATPTPAPWYRRIFRRKPKEALSAGQRPRSMRTDAGGGTRSGMHRFGHYLTRVLQVLVVVGMIAGAAGYSTNFMGLQGTINGTISNVVALVIPKVDPVKTSGTAKGSGIKAHPAQFLFDGSQGYWAAPFTTDKPPSITGAFTPPVTINKVIIHSGAFDKDFQVNARPRQVTMDFRDAAGVTVLSRTYEVLDTKDPQTFEAGAKGVVAVTVTVASVYLAQDPAAPVAMTEIEFLGAREGGAASTTPAP